MKHATFHFHDELQDFLSPDQQGQALVHPFDWRASIKDMIEALGVPHSEIELLVVNGQSVNFSHIVADDDHIHVYPRFDAGSLPGKIRLRPPLPRPPRFVLDIHLGRVAAYLRMLGFDTLYGDTSNHAVDFSDPLLARIAHEENRILLTRDVGLLKRGIVTYGYWVRSSTDPRQRLKEIVQRFDLQRDVELFKRCMKCNGLLQPVEKEDILHRLKPDTIRYFDVFHQCASCDRIYWKGSHFERLQGLIADVLG